MFYLLNVIKVQWVTFLSISGLYSHPKMLRIMTSVRRLRQERDMLHQTVCCTDTFNLQQISDGVIGVSKLGGGAKSHDIH